MAVPLLHGLGMAACTIAAVRAALWGLNAWTASVARNKRFAWDQVQLRTEVIAARAVRDKLESQRLVWTGWKKLQVKWVKQELDDCYSLYLVNPDGRPLPPYTPGQHLALSLTVPGHAKPLVRCYSLSDRYRPDYYRITVKRVLGPNRQSAGKVSSYLCQQERAGAFIDIKAPAGEFKFDLDSTMPAVLLAAGIGITPLFSMAAAAAEHAKKREILFFCCMRNGDEHLFRRELDMLRVQHPKLKVFVFYSKPLPTDVRGKDYSKAGRLHINDVLRILAPCDHDFYVCGPGDFLASMVNGLRNVGTPEQRLHFEAFGPSSVPRTGSPSAAETVAKARIVFEKSGVDVDWNGEHTSLLELAEASGVAMESGCRTGACGACMTALKRGKVRATANINVDAGCCLPCVSVPLENVVLDA